MRPVERLGVESTDDDDASRAGRVLKAAWPHLVECQVKLQSARSTMGSVAGLSDVVCSLLMCLLDVYFFKYERRMELWPSQAKPKF
jgi:hypothetical protein